MTGPLIDVSGFSVAFGDRRVLGPIDLAIAPGRRIGLVGESGSGKSTLALALLGLLPGRAKTEGVIRLDGQPLPFADDAAMTKLRGHRFGFVYQEPMTAFSPVHRIGRHLVDAVRAADPTLDRKTAALRAVELLDQVGIADAERRLRDYPRAFSGGMLQRVTIAAAIAGAPDLLIADEPTTALDVTTQTAIMALLDSLARERGCAVLLISHNLSMVRAFCDDIAVLYAGRIVDRFSSGEDGLRHPYTQALLDAEPRIGDGRQRLPVRFAGFDPIADPDEERL